MGINQKGVTHILVVIILILGLLAGLYLAQNPTFFRPRASEPKNSLSGPGVSVPIDRTPPVVNITKITGAVMINPTNGFIKGDRVEVLATATDNVGVKQVDFYIDTGTIGSSTASPYYAVWNTKAVVDGSKHLVYALGKDAAGNRGSSVYLNITMDRTPPTLTISAPLDNSNVIIGSVQPITATVSDKVSGVGSVVFQVNNATICTVLASPYNCNWTVPSQAGFYTITATATDKAGNPTTSTIKVYAQKFRTSN